MERQPRDYAGSRWIKQDSLNIWLSPAPHPSPHFQPPPKMTIRAYSVPSESEILLRKGILENSVLSSNLPANADLLASFVKFSGNAKPNLPINWRFAESISCLKGLEAIWLNALLGAKHKQSPVNIEIDT
jgi:hypothetical protein